jgi:hypothetical protein
MFMAVRTPPQLDFPDKIDFMSLGSSSELHCLVSILYYQTPFSVIERRRGSVIEDEGKSSPGEIQPKDSRRIIDRLRCGTECI